MRILTVSAHYPPDFVSGGTLQPQGLARGLAARGHASHVFAGWLGSEADRDPRRGDGMTGPAPLDRWDEVDDHGVHVHWVASWPWIGWGDDHNWHNPAVAGRFAELVAEIEPDVVHLHSLQGLGASLLPVARSAGARVVVTMHDFWWLCARQFLVDLDDQPCSLVLDCGECACHSGVAARDRRAAALRTMLDAADVVLAPSSSAVAVLVANGIAPGRIEVDANGITLQSDRLDAVRAARRPAGATVRFLYAGGPNPMKGSAVLVDALAQLEGTPAWALTAYALDEHLATSGASVAGLPVTLEPSFDPDALPDVLAAHDVLVLPSVMRETHSLLTREALTAGLPVVCTDTLGPEEVVEHGHNGLVVPAADPVALAHALRRLATDRELLDRLATGARHPIPLRSLDDQVADLEARYEKLLAREHGAGVGGPTARSTPPPSTVRSVLFVVGIEGAPLRYRAHLAAEAIGRRGVGSEVRHYRDPDLLGLARDADVVVLYRVPATHQILELIDVIHGTGTPCVFDVDDLIFDPAVRDEIPALRLLPPDEATLWLEGVNRYRTTLEACDAYIGSTAKLVAHAADVTGLPSHRWFNGVGEVLARQADVELHRPRRPGPVRIGYFSGTTTHDEDWAFVEPAVLAVLARHPDVELWLGGHLSGTDAVGVLSDAGRVRRLPFVSWLELPALLRDLDVNLAPLAPGTFNEAKSAIKWLEAALVATPTIASPTEPFRESVVPGTGLLAATTDEWEHHLEHLVTSEAERAAIGARARRHALLEWSPERQADRYLAILDAAVARGPVGARASTWTPVANDEPPAPVTVEAYPPPGWAPVRAEPPAPTLAVTGPVPVEVPTPYADRVAAVARRVESLGRRALASARRDGWGATLTRAGGRAVTKAKARARRP